MPGRHFLPKWPGIFYYTRLIFLLLWWGRQAGVLDTYLHFCLFYTPLENSKVVPVHCRAFGAGRADCGGSYPMGDQ